MVYGGTIITNPAGVETAVVDPEGAETVDVYVNPSCLMPDFNALSGRYTISFDQPEFIIDEVLDAVILTAPVDNQITFNGFTVRSASEWSTSASNYLEVTEKFVGFPSGEIVFSQPVKDIGFTLVNLNVGGVKVEFLDATGNVIANFNRNAAGGDSNPSNGGGGSLDYFIGYNSSAANISKIQFTPLYTDVMTIAVDDLSFTQELPPPPPVVVTNPANSETAVVDPAGAETVDVFVNPSCWMTEFNALVDRHTISFDQPEFAVGAVMDQVIFTTPISNQITFTGFTIQSASEWSTSANNYLKVTQNTQDAVSASIKFAIPVKDVGFNIVNFNAGGIQVQYYDANGNQINIAGQNANGGDPNPSSGMGGSLDLFFGYNSSSANISEIRFVPLYTTVMTIALDDLSFTQEPVHVTVTDPNGAATAVIDPDGAETVDVFVNPSCWMPNFNALADRYTLSFDQPEFVIGGKLDKVTFTNPISNEITFNGFKIMSASEWSTSASNYLDVMSKTMDLPSASIKFSKPVQNVGFNIVNFNAGGIEVQLLDANQNQIWYVRQNANGGDQNPSGALGGSLDLFVGYNSDAANISEIRFVPLYTTGMTIAVDDFSFVQPVEVVRIPGDANGDNMVDVGDLGILAANYGGSGKDWEHGDFNGDSLVDVGDLGILAANYGTNSSSANFEADYAKVFGTSVAEEESEETISNPICSGLGLSIIAGLALIGMMLIRLEE
jgi:hypothetical protein